MSGPLKPLPIHGQATRGPRASLVAISYRFLPVDILQAPEAQTHHVLSDPPLPLSLHFILQDVGPSIGPQHPGWDSSISSPFHGSPHAGGGLGF